MKLMTDEIGYSMTELNRVRDRFDWNDESSSALTEDLIRRVLAAS